jgi:hypothetical protein
MSSISSCAVIMTWLRFIPSSMIRAVSFVAAVAGTANIAAVASKIRDDVRMPPFPLMIIKKPPAR